MPKPPKPPAYPATPSQNAADWWLIQNRDINNKVHPEQQPAGWRYLIPTFPNSVGYMQTPVKNAAQSNLVLDYRVVIGSGLPEFLPADNSDTLPCRVRLVLWKIRTDGYIEWGPDYRWYTWFDENKPVLSPGAVTITAPLTDLTRWRNALGARADESSSLTAAYLDTLKLMNIGPALSGSSFGAHGAGTWGGEAWFHMDRMMIEA